MSTSAPPEASTPPTVVARPINLTDEVPYVWATTQRLYLELYGGDHAHRPSIDRLVGAILDSSAITVAHLSDDPFTLLGFVAVADDNSVEVLYLRQSLMPRRRWWENEPVKYDVSKLRVGADVVTALLGGRRAFTARRAIHPRVLEAVLAAGMAPTIVPVAL